MADRIEARMSGSLNMYNDGDHQYSFRDQPNPNGIEGVHAVLGIDIVAFSTLEDAHQVKAVQLLFDWVGTSLRGEGIFEEQYRWSPAGDGGYISFVSPKACILAIDVAFSILKKSINSDWTPPKRTSIDLRIALHTGVIYEGEEIGDRTNVWGVGINRAARMLSITAPSQILISQEYYNQCIRNYGRTSEFEFSVSYSRSVKHGEKLDIMNVCVNGLGLGRNIADANRWRVIGDQWERTVRSYELLIEDAMISNRPIAALAAAKCLLNFTAKRSSVTDLCKMMSESSDDVEGVIYPRQYHRFFSHFPYSSIERILSEAELVFRGSKPSDAYGITKSKEEQNSFICKKGAKSETTFFLISGRVRVEGIPGRKNFIAEAEEEIFGEFGLWFEQKSTNRSATLKAVSEECVLLEVKNETLRRQFVGSPAAQKGIQLLIANRIIENVKKSRKLFPEIEIQDDESKEERQEKKKLQEKLEKIYDSFECIKLERGDKILLSNDQFIDIAQLATDVAQLAEEINQPTNDVAERTNEIVQSAEEIAQSAEEIAQFAEEIAQFAEEIAQFAEEIAQFADGTTQPTPETNQPIADMAGRADGIAQRVRRAAQPTKEIVQLASDIAQLVEEITQPTNETVRLANETVRLANETVRLANETARLANGIAQATTETAQLTTEIAQRAAHKIACYSDDLIRELWEDASKVFVVFDGEIEIRTTCESHNNGQGGDNADSEKILITGKGEVGANQIVGVYSSLHENIDGFEATVQEETILVCFARKKLMDLYYHPYERLSRGRFKKPIIHSMDDTERQASDESRRYEEIKVGETLKEELTDKDVFFELSNFSYPEIIEHWDGLYGKRQSLIKRYKKPRLGNKND